jgi:hypothetical protein
MENMIVILSAVGGILVGVSISLWFLPKESKQINIAPLHVDIEDDDPMATAKIRRAQDRYYKENTPLEMQWLRDWEAKQGIAASKYSEKRVMSTLISADETVRMLREREKARKTREGRKGGS